MGRAPYEFSLGESRANRTSIAAAARYWAGHCTKSGQRLVDRLHSIACKADRVPRFSLTLQIGRVKNTRSLARSKFSQLVQRPGLERSHPAASQDEAER